MKKKFIFVMVSVVLLLSLTVSALALKTGTTEWDKPLFCQTTKKVVVSGTNGTQVKTLCDVTSPKFFNGKNPFRLCYTRAGKGSYSINGSVSANIRNAVNASASVSYSWTASQAASYAWDITSGKKVGYYHIVCKLKFYKHPYKYYTRTSTIFETGPWVQQKTKIDYLLEKGNNKIYFALKYT